MGSATAPGPSPGGEAARDRADGFVSGNVYDKFRTKNPVARAMMGGFLASARELLALARPRRILEVGCGPGDLAAHLVGPLRETTSVAQLSYLGTDVALEEVATARQAFPAGRFFPASAYRLPFPDRSFDTLIACEVFEHLEDPAAALSEVARVSSGHLLLSVPWEPVWRLLNLARARYLGAFGNTPGHVQHFSRGAIRRLVAGRFEILAERRPLPWTMLLARRREP